MERLKMFLLLFGIASNQIFKPVNIEIETTNRYCFIESIREIENKNYVEIEYVDFLIDEEAVAAAKEDNAIELEFEINEKNDTIFYLYNDYYIRSEDKKLKTLEVMEGVKIEIINFEYNPPVENVSLKELHSLIWEGGYGLYEITVNQSIVQTIKEVYLP